MSILPWSSLMSVRNPVIDQQHKVLLSLVNEIYAGVLFGHTADLFLDDFNNLQQCLDSHFRSEELLMDAAGFPGLDEHKQQHVILSDKLRDITKMIKNDEKTLDFEQICNFLSSWLTTHMMGEDQGYVDYIALVGQEVYDQIQPLAV